MVENLIKTGSEDNSLFIYYKKISSPMLTYKFPVKVLNNLLLTTFLSSILQVGDDVTKQDMYVGAMCWKKVTHFTHSNLMAVNYSVYE